MIQNEVSLFVTSLKRFLKASFLPISYAFHRRLLAANYCQLEHYQTVLAQLPALVSQKDYAGIESLLRSIGSYQLITNHRDLIKFFESPPHEIDTIVEIGVHDFGASTLTNLIRPKGSLYIGIDNWAYGLGRAKARAFQRSKHFANTVIFEHNTVFRKMPSSINDICLLIIDGNHSFYHSLQDCKFLNGLRDGGTVFMHDCGLGYRIWGVFWVYHLLCHRGVLSPVDSRYERNLALLKDKDKNMAEFAGTKCPEIEFGIARFSRSAFKDFQPEMQNPHVLWAEVSERFKLIGKINIYRQSYFMDELFK